MNELPVVCSCPKRKCPRHGDCVACREFHLHEKHPRPPRCAKKQGWIRRILDAAASAGR